MNLMEVTYIWHLNNEEAIFYLTKKNVCLMCVLHSKEISIKLK